MTDLLFRDDAYLRSCAARVVAIRPDGAIVLDRTVFYAASGGQPADAGTLRLASGAEIVIADVTFLDDAKTEIAHRPAPDSPAPAIGDEVTATIDWTVRHARMRMHTALHLLSVALPYPVTGGSVGEAEGRLDFDIPDPTLDKDAIEARVTALVAADHPVTSEWITDEELLANPALVKTMAVKPPIGTGRVRLVRIGTPETTVDLQPCGGTHVRMTAEIGAIAVAKIEKKGRLNRRVRLRFAEAG